ncbi:hypothetical protein K443DRAFT_1273 [Laccaria amethystina LaAM-08-1]|uniref:Uncharacterized protein n=1 Tax=Laccaria amethystina LaAM-08-1 TaxID=1095629 RepID=A0A0C9Y3Z4_9AGAR|nr:hypothetical protein K443DRAFT_1273 [Laccaria amethystina LaAM-08-1]
MAKKPPEYTASSTDTCKVNVKIGFGGDANWQGHLNGAAHSKNSIKPNSIK